MAWTPLLLLPNNLLSSDSPSFGSIARVRLKPPPVFSRRAALRLIPVGRGESQLPFERLHI